MTSSIYPLPITIKSGAIATSTNILESDVLITSDMVSPGGGAVLRIYFSIDFDLGSGEIDVYNIGVKKGSLNTDFAGAILTEGLYRFDIDVEAGDAINLQAAGSSIIEVIYVRFHLVQFGA